MSSAVMNTVSIVHIVYDHGTKAVSDRSTSSDSPWSLDFFCINSHCVILYLVQLGI